MLRNLVVVLAFVAVGLGAKERTGALVDNAKGKAWLSAL
jgi:hypothetical protein